MAGGVAVGEQEPVYGAAVDYGVSAELAQTTSLIKAHPYYVETVRTRMPDIICGSAERC